MGLLKKKRVPFCGFLYTHAYSLITSVFKVWTVLASQEGLSGLEASGQ